VRLLYLIDSLGPGGAERSLAAMAPGYVGRGIELEVAFLHDRRGLQDELERAGARLCSLAGPGGRPGWMRRVRRLLTVRRPDLVHTTLFEADLAGRVGARLAGVPVVSSLVNVAYGPEQAGAAAADAWRSSFRRAPCLREQLVLLGVLVETFETAVTWDRLDELVDQVTGATQAALAEVCGAGMVTCRLTHAYPDGAAPYFTVLAPARRGSELSQWAEVQAAAAEAVLAAGGTITHHHAVGRQHRPWYERQRPGPFGLALAAAKAAVDPTGVLNPGVLLPT
jgi:FAD/FMN-containing dehydrogenase